MDGTLAEFRKVDTLEKLYEKGYFLNLEPHMNVVDSIRSIVTDHSEIEVYILSAVLSDSPYAVTEKNAWLDQYLPEIDISHRLYPHCGTDKKEFLEKEFGSIGNKDFLLDDYSANLHSWEPPAKGIKLMNGINGNHGTWNKEKVSIECEAADMTECILNIIANNGNVDDIFAFLIDHQIPSDEVTLMNMAEDILKNPPKIGYLTISNALQWRLQYRRIVNLTETVEGITQIVKYSDDSE